MSPLPIYIISLKRTPERRLYMQRQLDALNLNYQFVEAIDKYDLYSEARRTSIARQLDIDRSDMESIYKNCKNIGPVACMLSHLKVHGLMVKRNISKACILEDDSLILSSFPEILAACQKVPGDLFMLSSKSSIITYIGRKFLREEMQTSRLLIFVYELVRYKKYWPQLNPHTLRRTMQCFVKYLFLKYLRKIRAKLFQTEYKEEQTKDVKTFATEIGALPTQDKASWHKITPKHYMANPFMGPRGSEGSKPVSITLCMAYVLTRSVAIKLKQATIDLSRKMEERRMSGQPIPGYASKNLEIDHIPRYLYYKGDINLYILVPPCIKATPKYIMHSARIS